MTVNVATRAGLFRRINDCFARREGFALATLNLDHLTKLPDDPAFAEAYRAHDFVVADGRPIVWLSRLAGRRIELLTGSDLVVPLAGEAARAGVSVALVGSSQEALEGARAALIRAVPDLEVSFLHAPPFGFTPNGAAAAQICTGLAQSGAGLCFVALGAPKQEIFAAFAKERCPGVGFASIGAGLDFLSRHQIRAPKLMRALALEWLWRTVQSPRRMGPRYAKCAAILPSLTLQVLRRR